MLLPGQTLQFGAALNGAAPTSPVWQVNGLQGGSGASGTISSTGMYTAPAAAPSAAPQVSVTDLASNTHSAAVSVSVFQATSFTPGTVSPTSNPLVAMYSLAAPQGTKVRVLFGSTTNYGLSTWAQPAPQGGGTVSIYVAGMRASSTYHMKGVISMPDGSTVGDADQTFTTGAVAADALPVVTTQLTGTGSPNPGIEMLSYVQGGTQDLISALATDLEGNVIWYYSLPAGAFPEPVKLLPNGHMMVVTGGTLNDIREIDLAGDIINQITLDQITGISVLQNKLWQGFNHDVLPLPNGHFILLGSIQETVSGVAGVTDGTAVSGNVLIDWDPQNGPVWTWSTFDHLDLTRAPYGIADWTHANAVIYSPDDDDLILSMRNQNWVVKINYQGGAGDGSILWRFGPGGDFTMPTAPIDWNYGQHYPTIQSPNSSGVFNLMVFDNGNGRMVDASNDVCGTAGFQACYSSVPIYQLDESAKTATVLWEDNLLSAFSFCCGDAQVLPNGNVEFDVAADQNFTPAVSYIEEVTQTPVPQLVWQMNVQGSLANTDLVYRGIRTPSLYPGVTWTQADIATANATAAAEVVPSHH